MKKSFLFLTWTSQCHKVGYKSFAAFAQGFRIKGLKACPLLYLILILVGLSLLTASCGLEVTNNGDSIGTIKEAKLTGMEINLLTALTNQSFIFDFSMSGKALYMVDLKLDYYLEGEPQGETSLQAREVSGGGSIVIAFSNIPESGESWVLSVISDSSVTSIQTLLQPVQEDASLWLWVRSSGRNEIREGEPVILAARASDDGTSTIPLSIFERDEEALQEFLGNKQVFIFSVVFTKEPDSQSPILSMQLL